MEDGKCFSSSLGTNTEMSHCRCEGRDFSFTERSTVAWRHNFAETPPSVWVELLGGSTSPWSCVMRSSGTLDVHEALFCSGASVRDRIHSSSSKDSEESSSLSSTRKGNVGIQKASLTCGSEAVPVLLRPCSLTALRAALHLPPPQAACVARACSAFEGCVPRNQGCGPVLPAIC